MAVFTIHSGVLLSTEMASDGVTDSGMAMVMVGTDGTDGEVRSMAIDTIITDPILEEAMLITDMMMVALTGIHP